MVLENSQTLILASLGLFSNQLNFSASGSFLIFLVLACLWPPLLILTIDQEWVPVRRKQMAHSAGILKRLMKGLLRDEGRAKEPTRDAEHPVTHNGGMPCHYLPGAEG